MQAVESPYGPGVVGIVCGDMPRCHRFQVSLNFLLVPLNSACQFIQGQDVACNRNLVVREALKQCPEMEWLWFIDDDHPFNPDILLRLLASEADIVQPLCCTRKPPYRPYAYRLKKTGVWEEKHRGVQQPLVDLELHYDGVAWPDLPKSGLLYCDAVGTGGMLIRRPVLDAIAAPWFERGRTRSDFLDEDRYFCFKAKHKGYSVAVNVDVRMGHMAVGDVWPALDEEGNWRVDMDLGSGVRLRTPKDFAEGVARTIE